jgi:hypothetical protein
VRNKGVGLVGTPKDEYLDKQAAILDSPTPSGSDLKAYQEFFQQTRFTRR